MNSDRGRDDCFARRQAAQSFGRHDSPRAWRGKPMTQRLSEPVRRQRPILISPRSPLVVGAALRICGIYAPTTDGLANPARPASSSAGSVENMCVSSRVSSCFRTPWLLERLRAVPPIRRALRSCSHQKGSAILTGIFQGRSSGSSTQLPNSCSHVRQSLDSALRRESWTRHKRDKAA